MFGGQSGLKVRRRRIHGIPLSGRRQLAELIRKLDRIESGLDLLKPRNLLQQARGRIGAIGTRYRPDLLGQAQGGFSLLRRDFDRLNTRVMRFPRVGAAIGALDLGCDAVQNVILDGNHIRTERSRWVKYNPLAATDHQRGMRTRPRSGADHRIERQCRRPRIAVRSGHDLGLIGLRALRAGTAGHGHCQQAGKNNPDHGRSRSGLSGEYRQEKAQERNSDHTPCGGLDEPVKGLGLNGNVHFAVLVFSHVKRIPIRVFEMLDNRKTRALSRRHSRAGPPEANTEQPGYPNPHRQGSPVQGPPPNRTAIYMASAVMEWAERI